MYSNLNINYYTLYIDPCFKLFLHKQWLVDNNKTTDLRKTFFKKQVINTNLFYYKSGNFISLRLIYCTSISYNTNKLSLTTLLKTYFDLNMNIIVLLNFFKQFKYIYLLNFNIFFYYLLNFSKINILKWRFFDQTMSKLSVNYETINKNNLIMHNIKYI